MSDWCVRLSALCFKLGKEPVNLQEVKNLEEPRNHKDRKDNADPTDHKDHRTLYDVHMSLYDFLRIV